MKSTPSLILGTLTLALLSACGGDGGNDSVSTPVGAQSVAITTNNESPVARATIAGGFALALTQTSDTNATTAAAVGSKSAHSIGAAVHAAIAAASRRATAAGARADAATAPDTEACGVSGTSTSTFDDKDNNGTASAGDVISITFAQCRDSSSSVLNGTISITLTSVTSASQFVASATLQNFDVSEVDISSVLNGAVTITEANTTSTSNSTLVVGSGGMTVQSTASNYNDTITFADGMRIVTNEASGQDTTSLDGTLSATSIGGSIVVATVQPIMQLDTDTYPSAGQVRVTGANSALLITALNATQVQLQLDSNGDGTYDGTTVVAWSTLLP